MGIRMKKLIAFIMIPVILAGMLCGCASTPDWAKEILNQYEKVSYRNVKIFDREAGCDFRMEQMILVESVDDLDELDMSVDLNYGELFFFGYDLLLLQFTHAGSEKIQEFTDLVVKDGTLYAVLTVSSPEVNTMNYCQTLITLEVPKDLQYDLGEIMVINTEDESRGSCYHDRLQ